MKTRKNIELKVGTIDPAEFFLEDKFTLGELADHIEDMRWELSKDRRDLYYQFSGNVIEIFERRQENNKEYAERMEREEKEEKEERERDAS